VEGDGMGRIGLTEVLAVFDMLADALNVTP
jgi:hypothetical protein